MVCLLIAGRTGNQFFQYSMARSIQVDFGGQLAIDFSILDGMGDKSFTDTLAFFNTVKYKRMSIKKCFPIRWKIIRLVEKCRPTHNSFGCYIYDMITSHILNVFSICYYKSTYKSKRFFRGILNDYIVCGWFESANYFKEIDDFIRNELTLRKEYKEEKNEKLKEYLNKAQSICISIRRGNFVSDPNLKKSFYVCDENYYYSAIERLAGQLENPIIYVCSDDVKWCKDNMKFSYETIYEEEGLEAYQKIDVMSACHHFVISNSTFSWWAQHLCNHSDKMVISPSCWRNDKLAPKDIFEKGWIYLETDKT